jgi:ADP-ribose pyrophosphatase
MSTPRSHGPWQILARNQVYRDPWVELLRDEVIRPDGAPGSHVLVRLKPGVTVLAIDDSQTAYLTEEFHYAVGRETIECVSGGIDGNEPAEETARRELAEELGIAAGKWIDLGTCDPFTSVVASPTRLFLAQRLTFGIAALEGSESLRMRAVPFAEALHMVLDGRITHAPSCLAILKARIVLAGTS